MLVAVVVFLALADRYQGSLCKMLLEMKMVRRRPGRCCDRGCDGCQAEQPYLCMPGTWKNSRCFIQLCPPSTDDFHSQLLILKEENS